MNTQRIWRPAVVTPLSAVLVLAAIASAGDLFTPPSAHAQVRPEVGGMVGLMTGMGGDAFSGFADAFGLGAEAGADLGSGWGVSGGGAWSEHDRETDLGIPGDLWRFSARIRREFRLPETRLHPFLGIRGGVAAVDYDTSVLALVELDLLPGTRVNDSDAGLLIGPELGVTAPLGDRWAGELRGAYEFADVDPVIVGPDEEPGWSHSAVVSASVKFRP